MKTLLVKTLFQYNSIKDGKIANDLWTLLQGNNMLFTWHAPQHALPVSQSKHRTCEALMTWQKSSRFSNYELSFAHIKPLIWQWKIGSKNIITCTFHTAWKSLIEFFFYRRFPHPVSQLAFDSVLSLRNWLSLILGTDIRFRFHTRHIAWIGTS